MKELSTKFINLLVKEFKTYVRQLERSVYMSIMTCFMILQYHHLQAADIILHLKMLEIIFIQWQLSISFQSWIRLIWTWIIKSRNNNNQMITSFSRLWGETCRWLGSNWHEMLRDKGLIFRFLQRNLIQSLFSVCQTECHPLNNWFYKMWLRMLFHIT